MGSAEQLLLQATLTLPAEVAGAVRRGLECGWYRVGAFVYESDLTVCPLVAGAKLAGVWQNGAIAAGNPVWGNPEEPSEAVEDFVGAFDWCAEELGTKEALATLRLALGCGRDLERTEPALAVAA